MISSLQSTPGLDADPAVQRLMRRQRGTPTERVSRQSVQPMGDTDPQAAQRLMRRQALQAVQDRPRLTKGPLGLPVQVGQEQQVGGWNNSTGGDFGDYVRTPTGEKVMKASADIDPVTGSYRRRPLEPATTAPARPAPSTAQTMAGAGAQAATTAAAQGPLAVPGALADAAKRLLRRS